MRLSFIVFIFLLLNAYSNGTVVHRSHEDRLLKRAIERYVESDNNLLLTMSTLSYVDMARTWIERLRATSYAGKYLMLGLDDRVCDALRAKDSTVPCESASQLAGFHFERNATKLSAGSQLDQLRLSDLWQLRTAFVSRVVALGFNVLHCDVDAVWLKPPFGRGNPVTGTGHDVVMSRGKWPVSVRKVWGFAGVMGLAYFRAAPSVAKMLRETSKLWDDQVAINEALYHANISDTWQHYKPIPHAYEGIARFANNRSVTVLNVPYSIVMRHCEPSAAPPPTAVAAHCLSKHTGEDKVATLRRVGLLPNDDKEEAHDDNNQTLSIADDAVPLKLLSTRRADIIERIEQQRGYPTHVRVRAQQIDDPDRVFVSQTRRKEQAAQQSLMRQEKRERLRFDASHRPSHPVRLFRAKRDGD
jgi:Nucleotide-diphospho-sugar transferase